MPDGRMTRLWVLSDLHLEAVPHPEAFQPVRPEFDVLAVAGDVWEGDSDQALRIVADLAGGKPSVFVMGNHEPWNSELGQQRQRAARAAERYGVTLLDDSEAAIGELRFVGGTLWGDGRLAGRHATPNVATGERIVIGQGRGAHPITGKDQADLHRATCSMIEAAVAAEDPRPLVVVTHHAPHPLCLPAAHRTGWIAGNSASDLSELLDTGRVALWVHGHIHDTIDLTHASGTRIVCNAAGPRFHNPAFREDWVIEIEVSAPDQVTSRSSSSRVGATLST